MSADTSPFSILLTAAATAAMARGPHLMASAGFGPGEDPRPMLVWYAIGGLAFLALFTRNVIGAWRDFKGKGAPVELERRLSALESRQGTPPEEHKGDLAAVYQRIESHRLETEQKIQRLTATASQLHADLAASRAETRTLNTSVREMLKLLAADNKPH